MYTASKKINQIHPFFQYIPHILNNTSSFEQFMLFLRHQTFRIVPRSNIQPFLFLEKLSQLFFSQKIPCNTDKYSLKIYNQMFQRSIILNIFQDKENLFKIPFAIAYSMQFKSVELSFRSYPLFSYFFCY